MHKAYWAALALSGALLACQQDEEPTLNPGPFAEAGVSPILGDAGNFAPVDAGSPTQTPQQPVQGQLPCAVKTIVERYCGTCHGAQPQFGASIPLTTAAHFQSVAPIGKQAVHLAAIDRIGRTGPGLMPPAQQPQLPAADKETLLNWLRAGAQAGTACAAPQPTNDAGAVVSDAGGSDAGSVTPKPDAGPAQTNDCDVNFELRATDGKGGKFLIPQSDDHYECFYFKANVEAGTLATVLSPLLDDTRTLHHWLLFAAPNENESPSGTHRQCDGIHPGAYLMAAWLPGTPELVMPPDVGMEMPSGGGAQFILENHYNNIPRYKNATDNSGVKVCATKKPKSQHAAIHWLGSELITLAPSSMGSAQGTCAPTSQKPIHILGVIPHMHKLGRHVSMTIMRANGSTEMLHDAAFEFENQAYFGKQVVLNPGDKVRTRCDYMNNTNGVVTLGEKTSNEMCYMFTLAYPVGSMNTGGDYLNPLTGQPIIQGPNRCMR